MSAGVSLWRIATEGSSWRADDLSGKGAALSGGRWNSKNDAVVYCASSIALACLETVVHFNPMGLPVKRFAVEITVPDDAWASAFRPAPDELPADWNAQPAGIASARFGSQWLRSQRSLLMLLPSVIFLFQKIIYL